MLKSDYASLNQRSAQMAGESLCSPATQGAVQEAISRANGIANLLENTNGLLDNTLSRLTGGVAVPSGENFKSPQSPGDVGELMAVLDRVYALASLNSDYAGQVARL
jgi:hypothetical protein